jgi:hypothetical protein
MAVGHSVEMGRPYNHVSSINLVPDELEAANRKRFARYGQIKKELLRYEEIEVKTRMSSLWRMALRRVFRTERWRWRGQGHEGWAFPPGHAVALPYARLLELAEKGKRFLCVEMSMGPDGRGCKTGGEWKSAGVLLWSLRREHPKPGRGVRRSGAPHGQMSKGAEYGTCIRASQKPETNTDKILPRLRPWSDSQNHRRSR